MPEGEQARRAEPRAEERGEPHALQRARCQRAGSCGVPACPLACSTTCPMEEASGAYQVMAQPDKATKTAVKAKGAKVDRTALVSQWRRSSDLRRLKSA